MGETSLETGEGAGPPGAPGVTLTLAALSRLQEGVFASTNERQEGGAGAPECSGIGGAACAPLGMPGVVGLCWGALCWGWVTRALEALEAAGVV